MTALLWPEAGLISTTPCSVVAPCSLAGWYQGGQTDQGPACPKCFAPVSRKAQLVLRGDLILALSSRYIQPSWPWSRSHEVGNANELT